MPKSKSTTARFVLLAAAMVVSAAVPLSTSAFAKEPPVYTATQEKVGLSGYDAVAYFTAGKPTKGDAKFKASYNGANWYFASEANKAAFVAEPAKFAPQYGGYCSWAVSQGYTASGDPEAWKIVDGKLYVNYNKEVAANWSQNIPVNIKNANANWPKVLDK
jgi:YHS domain-containing protein